MTSVPERSGQLELGERLQGVHWSTGGALGSRAQGQYLPRVALNYPVGGVLAQAVFCTRLVGLSGSLWVVAPLWLSPWAYTVFLNTL